MHTLTEIQEAARLMDWILSDEPEEEPEHVADAMAAAARESNEDLPVPPEHNNP